MRFAIALSLLALPCTAFAQQPAAPADASLGVSAARGNWQQMTKYITMAAEELPEADYAYRPVATVRSFGQLFAHVAGAQHMMCGAALGEPPAAEDAVEKTATTKAAIVKALKESTEHCTRAYGQPDAATAAQTELFGQKWTRMSVLSLNAVHNGEHYGNIVTYMRMKGMVPPSSRRQ